MKQLLKVLSYGIATVITFALTIVISALILMLLLYVFTVVL